jgi:hypothetical protein
MGAARMQEQDKLDRVQEALGGKQRGCQFVGNESGIIPDCSSKLLLSHNIMDERQAHMMHRLACLLSVPWRDQHGV